MSPLSYEHSSFLTVGSKEWSGDSIHTGKNILFSLVYPSLDSNPLSRLNGFIFLPLVNNSLLPFFPVFFLPSFCSPNSRPFYTSISIFVYPYLVIWSIITILPSFVPSPQRFLFCPFFLSLFIHSYLFLCFFRSFFLFRIPGVESYHLYHHHTDVYALSFNAYYLCRLQFSLCYHYFTLLQVSFEEAFHCRWMSMRMKRLRCRRFWAKWKPFPSWVMILTSICRVSCSWFQLLRVFEWYDRPKKKRSM